jgi:uncharacterized membrane protein YkgB
VGFDQRVGDRQPDPRSAALVVVLFMGTLSFLFTAPGVVATHAAGIAVLSAQPGQFLLKDVVLIGVALWTRGDSLRAIAGQASTRPNGTRANVTVPS